MKQSFSAIATARISPLLLFIFSLLIATPRFALAKDEHEPKWIEVHSAHFSVITDAGEKRGREISLRVEQMRSIFSQLTLKDKLKLPVPITVLALKSEKQFGAIAPAKQALAPGLYVPGSDRVYIVLNLSAPDPWRSVAHPLAHYFLNYNYPPAAGWFDEGLAEYFGSIQIGREVNLGGDPKLAPEWHEDIFDQMRRDPNVPQSLTQLLSSPVWLSMVDLFSMKHDGSGAREGTHNTIYYAQSWMVVHYLLKKNKLPQAGTYFDLVQNQKLPVEKAMVQAFDMSPSQFEDAVKTYFKSLSGLGLALDESKRPNIDPDIPSQPDHFAPPFGIDDIGMAVTPMKDEDVRAVLGDVTARIPEHHDQALRDLQQLTASVQDNEIAHRGLAADHIRQKKFEAAADELEKATDLNARDAWIWYYRSAMKYQEAQATRQQMRGLANMMQDLRAVTDWYPDLADAYNMLGMARIEGGGTNSALEAQRQSIALAPRNAEYLFNLGQIYVAGKKWDQARDVFTRLKSGSDRAAASASKKQLDDLDTLQKYGLRPEHAGYSQAPVGAASTPAANASAPIKPAPPPKATVANEDEDEERSAVEAKPPAPIKPGTTGPVQFFKGKIVSSDCSRSPEATVTVLSGMTTYTLHTSDFKSLLVIGENQFSCEWTNRLVSINYRAIGKQGGELVSIELR